VRKKLRARCFVTFAPADAENSDPASESGKSHARVPRWRVVETPSNLRSNCNKDWIALSAEAPFAARRTPVSHAHESKIRRRDAVGMLVSLLCLVHCLVAPILVAAMPALGIGFLAIDGVHFAFAIAVLLAAVAALIPGYRQHHRVSVLVLGAAGVLLVTIGATLPEGLPETGVTVVGSALMIAAHVTNLRHARLHVHPPRFASDS
jgi:hypothetical protein